MDRDILQYVIRARNEASPAVRSATNDLHAHAAGLGAVSRAVERHGRVGRAMGAVSLGIAAGLGAATVKSAGFDAQLRENLTMVDLGIDRLGELKRSTLAVAQDDSITAYANELGAAGYRVLGFTGDVGDGYKSVLREGARLADAGRAELNPTLNTTVRILRAYGKPATEARDVTESLFTAVRGGLPTLTEWGDAFARAHGISAALGAEMPEVNALLVAMSDALSPNEAATAWISLMRAFARPSDEFALILEDIGYKADQGISSIGGAAGAVKLLQEYTAGSKERLAELGLEQEAFNALMLITANNGERYNGLLAAQAQRYGSVDDALRKLDGPQRRWEKSLQQADMAVHGLGETFLPVMSDIADATTSVASAWNELPEPIQKVTGYVIAGAGAIAGLVAGETLLRIGFARMRGEMMENKAANAAWRVGLQDSRLALDGNRVSLAGLGGALDAQEQALHAEETATKRDTAATKDNTAAKRANRQATDAAATASWRLARADTGTRRSWFPGDRSSGPAGVRGQWALADVGRTRSGGWLPGDVVDPSMRFGRPTVRGYRMPDVARMGGGPVNAGTDPLVRLAFMRGSGRAGAAGRLGGGGAMGLADLAGTGLMMFGGAGGAEVGAGISMGAQGLSMLSAMAPAIAGALPVLLPAAAAAAVALPMYHEMVVKSRNDLLGRKKSELETMADAERQGKRFRYQGKDVDVDAARAYDAQASKKDRKHLAAVAELAAEGDEKELRRSLEYAKKKDPELYNWLVAQLPNLERRQLTEAERLHETRGERVRDYKQEQMETSYQENVAAERAAWDEQRKANAMPPAPAGDGYGTVVQQNFYVNDMARVGEEAKRQAQGEIDRQLPAY